MWKLLLGFALFAGMAFFLLKNAGGGLDMGGEKHAIDVTPEPAASAPAK